MVRVYSSTRDLESMDACEMKKRQPSTSRRTGTWSATTERTLTLVAVRSGRTCGLARPAPGSAVHCCRGRTREERRVTKGNHAPLGQSRATGFTSSPRQRTAGGSARCAAAQAPLSSAPAPPSFEGSPAAERRASARGEVSRKRPRVCRAAACQSRGLTLSSASVRAWRSSWRRLLGWAKAERSGC